MCVWAIVKDFESSRLLRPCMMIGLSRVTMHALCKRCLLCVFVVSFCILLSIRPAVAVNCPDYSNFARELHEPFSEGRSKLSYQRPERQCRTFVSRVVERTIMSLKRTIKDPDLYRLFSNAFPNTLDTTVKWRGHAANNSEEELAFVITGKSSPLQ